MTGRADDAAAIVDHAQELQGGRSHILTTLSETMHALATRSAPVVAHAVETARALAMVSGFWSIISLALLGAIDDAFRVSEAYFATPWTMDAASRTRRSGMPATELLFVPATVNLRDDSRFSALVQRIGLTAYWRISANRPDYLHGGLLPK